ncbi:MAG: 5-(carboxyamino)imidazole ribonucleotide mutase [Anaerovibrio sp.]|nr:5-(carboxyamino)imidazole ribonucleotide mutase [Anaerovibrio sp.]
MKAAIIMGSDSDWPILKPAYELLKQFGIEAEVFVASAHRTPAKVKEIVSTAPERGVGAFISAAGAAAHLGGVIASYTTLPVIGVPINATSLNGMDALLSTVQMPSGIPVATMAVNGAKNAAIFVAEIFAISDKEIKDKLLRYREKMVEDVEAKANRVAQQLNKA